MKMRAIAVVLVLAAAGCQRSEKIESAAPSKPAAETNAVKPGTAADASVLKAPEPVSAANPNPSPALNMSNTNDVAVVKTSLGEMVLEFWPDVAPNTVSNFIKLAQSGFYDGTCFHRVIKGFMIQGGDPKTKDASKEMEWGTGDPGYKIKAEFNPRSHTRGVLSMARSADPDSAGSQFFICHGDPTQLDNQYTTFGKLIKGDDVLEKIATTPTHPPDRPNTRVNVESIKIVPANTVK